MKISLFKKIFGRNKEVESIPVVESSSNVEFVSTFREPLRFRKMEIVCAIDEMPVDVYETLNKNCSHFLWAYIVHDKENCRPHYHIFIDFGCISFSFLEVAEWFNISPLCVTKCHGRRVDTLRYLVQSLPWQQSKYQYDLSEVHSNFDVKAEIENTCF